MHERPFSKSIEMDNRDVRQPRRREQAAEPHMQRPVRHTHIEQAAWTQHAPGFLDRRKGPGQMVQHVQKHDDIRRFIWQCTGRPSRFIDLQPTGSCLRDGLERKLEPDCAPSSFPRLFQQGADPAPHIHQHAGMRPERLHQIQHVAVQIVPGRPLLLRSETAPIPVAIPTEQLRRVRHDLRRQQPASSASQQLPASSCSHQRSARLSTSARHKSGMSRLSHFYPPARPTSWRS